MQKCLVICSIVILFVLLQTDAHLSSSRGGTRRQHSSSNRGSSHKPSRPSTPALQPSRPVHKPSRPVHQLSRPVHQPSRPAYQPSRLVHQPNTPVQQPIRPVQQPNRLVHKNTYFNSNPGQAAGLPNFPMNPPHPAYPHNGGTHYNMKTPGRISSKQKDKGWAVVAQKMIRDMSKMIFNFNNRDEERWWYENRNRYSDRVYFPMYEQPVPQDVFVKDCCNITVREFITPTGNETVDEMETRVVTRVVQEMCIEQYRSFSGQVEGDSIGQPDPNLQQPNPSKPVMKFVEGEAIIVSPVEETDG